MLSFFNKLFVSAASRPQLEQATPVSAATSDTQQQSLPETSELTTSADKVSGGSVDTDATSFVSSKPSLVAALTVADLPDIKKPIASDKPTTNILAKPPGGQISPTDSGYGSHPEMCNNDKRTQVKRNKLRLVRKRFSEQCKKIWNNASNARHKIGHDDAIENDHEEEDYGATDEESKDEESGDEEEDDSAHPRCDFKTIEAIKDDKIVDLVLLRCKPTDKAVEARVVHRTKGAYNFAAIVKVSGNDASHDFVVRIPGHATPARWTPEDEYMMEREVQLITYIHDRTSAPVPEIVSYSTKHENPLGVPYVLMTALPGKSANSIWYDANDDDELTDDDDDEVAFRHADMPSTATEKKRITFLRSLARIMSEIQALSFDKGGMAIFADGAAPTFGPMYTWGPDSSNKARKHTAFRSTQEYFFLGMVRHLSRLTAESPPSEDGCQQFFHILMNQAVFKPAAPETFTIHHNDLDLQNILVDDDGNVTGIIDWDAAFIAPRCMAAGPLFLQKDWFPDYLNNLQTGPHMGWKTPYYRNIYAAALMEAGHPDAIYATKSPIYRAALAAVQYVDTSNMQDLIDKLLREIPHVRVKALDFTRALGLGWKDAEEMLQAELAKILEPELPRPGLLKDLDAEMALKEWYLAFNLEEDEDEDAKEDESQDGSDGEPDDGSSQHES